MQSIIIIISITTSNINKNSFIDDIKLEKNEETLLLTNDKFEIKILNKEKQKNIETNDDKSLHKEVSSDWDEYYECYISTLLRYVDCLKEQKQFYEKSSIEIEGRKKSNPTNPSYFADFTKKTKEMNFDYNMLKEILEEDINQLNKIKKEVLTEKQLIDHDEECDSHEKLVAKLSNEILFLKNDFNYMAKVKYGKKLNDWIKNK